MKHENLATSVEWTTEQILHSASADQSIRTWRIDQQKCVKTLDVSPYKNEIREDSSETRVNVSPPLGTNHHNFHHIFVINDFSSHDFDFTQQQAGICSCWM